MDNHMAELSVKYHLKNEDSYLLYKKKNLVAKTWENTMKPNECLETWFLLDKQNQYSDMEYIIMKCFSLTKNYTRMTHINSTQC